MKTSPRGVLDIEEDSPELEAELLKGIDGKFARYSAKEFRERTERLIQRSRESGRLKFPSGSGLRRFTPL